MKKYMTLFLVSGIMILTLLGTSCTDAPAEAAPTENVSSGNPELDALTQQVMQFPNDPELRFKRAQLYHSLEGYDQAMADLNAAMTIDTTKAEYFHLLADVYLDNYNSRLALGVMLNAAKRFPDRIPTLLKLSEFQMILKQNDESLKTINSILEKAPQEAEAYMMMGMNFRDVGDIDRAINSFQTAVEMNSELIDGWIILGNLFAEKKEPIAERYFNTAVSIDPENTATLTARGSYHMLYGSLDKAKTDFEQVISLDRQNSNAYFNLGLALIEQDSIPKANNMFNITIETNPLYLKAYYFRGMTYEMLGDPQKAYSDYQQVHRHDPEYKDVAERVEKLKPSS